MRDSFKKKIGKWLMQVFPAIMFCAGALLAAPAYSASKTVLVLGDSLSAEYGLARGTGWVALLQKRLQQEKIPVPIVNASISGETTSGGRTRLPALLKAHKPSVVVVELGANDGLRGLSLQTFENNLRAIVNSSQISGATVLLLGMQLPPNYGTEYTKAFASTYLKIAQRTKSPIVPFFLEGIKSNPGYFQPDRLHPTAEAQKVILDTVWPALKPLLNK